VLVRVNLGAASPTLALASTFSAFFSASFLAGTGWAVVDVEGLPSGPMLVEVWAAATIAIEPTATSANRDLIFIFIVLLLKELETNVSRCERSTKET
jgi:hypothetical protein